MEKRKIGQIVNAVGLKGEVKVYHYTDYKERFAEIKTIFLEETACPIDGVRYQKEMVILKLRGINSRTEAEAQKGKQLFIGEEDIRILPEDTYYIHDLVGLSVIDEQGAHLGTLVDVIQHPGQDLYEVERADKKKFLIPAVDQFILTVNLQESFVQIKLMEGLMD